MKVLFVTGEFPPMQGGVGDYTREIGRALRDLGCEVHVATSTKAKPVAGLHVHPVVERWGWGCWRVLLDLVRAQRPDVVHVQYQAAAYAMHPAINLFPRRLRWLGDDRPRTAVTFHDLKVPYLFPKAGPLRRWIVTELARSSDAAITTNQEDFEALQQALGRPPALIPIGSNIAPPARPPQGGGRSAWRARWGAGPDDLLLCFFGFINDKKGVDTLLHALASDPLNPAKHPEPVEGHPEPVEGHPELGEGHPEPVEGHPEPVEGPLLLFIGGRTGASDPTNVGYLAHIEALIAELGLAERVRWTGYLPPDEVSASFWAADLCVLPYRDGVSFLHGTFHAALAHGVPVVTTRPRVPLPELRHGENVYLVPPQEPQALAEAIDHLAGAPALRRRLGRGAQELAREFRWEKIAADTLVLYRTLAAQS